ncbi:MAG: 16S rRNA (uracil(1498)-N(3))-methyltransferase [Bacteroidaceae bacterium]|nr:16S rRNA (uracil(1498)-N(3))-methyltransferase [Bacteroidaceae bacterium]
MKETRYFYAPDAATSTELPGDEAGHALRVLRMGVGDELLLVDGNGCFYRATITAATGHRCTYRIEETMPQQPAWLGHLHLAMAPTKLLDRVEWFAEKATEIGFDELTFLDCQFSERRVVKKERIDKILVSAMKQSHKAWKPKLNGMQRFRDFISEEREGDKFICHCYDAEQGTDGTAGWEKPFLFDVLRPGVPTTVLIGPEGDFSIDEVRLAMQHGYRSVSLGKSRLRTETAALVAVHMMQLRNT